jgi:hypothetical protein
MWVIRTSMRDTRRLSSQWGIKYYNIENVKLNFTVFGYQSLIIIFIVCWRLIWHSGLYTHLLGRGFHLRTIQTFVCMNMCICLGVSMYYVYHHHHYHPLILLSGIGTTCFLLPFSSITPFIPVPSFTQSIHLFLGRPLLGCPFIFILLTPFVMWLPFIHITCLYQASCFSFSQSLRYFQTSPKIYSFLILSILVTSNIQWRPIWRSGGNTHLLRKLSRVTGSIPAQCKYLCA